MSLRVDELQRPRSAPRRRPRTPALNQRLYDLWLYGICLCGWICVRAYAATACSFSQTRPQSGLTATHCRASMRPSLRGYHGLAGDLEPKSRHLVREPICEREVRPTHFAVDNLALPGGHQKENTGLSPRCAACLFLCLGFQAGHSARATTPSTTSPAAEMPIFLC